MRSREYVGVSKKHKLESRKEDSLFVRSLILYFLLQSYVNSSTQTFTCNGLTV